MPKHILKLPKYDGTGSFETFSRSVPELCLVQQMDQGRAARVPPKLLRKGRRSSPLGLQFRNYCFPIKKDEGVERALRRRPSVGQMQVRAKEPQT